MDLFDTLRIWKIEEVGECSIILSLPIQRLKEGRILLPNPNHAFTEKYGKYYPSKFTATFGVKSKEVLYSPATLVVYFEDKVPDWAEVGMEVLY